MGQTFLDKYKNHNDAVTIIDQKHTYGVRAPTIHPIYENFRVKVRLPSRIKLATSNRFFVLIFASFCSIIMRCVDHGQYTEIQVF